MNLSFELDYLGPWEYYHDQQCMNEVLSQLDFQYSESFPLNKLEAF